MPVLVRDHVGLGERARRSRRSGRELVEEVEVDVDVLVGRAVERADLRASRGRSPVCTEPVKNTVVALRVRRAACSNAADQ